MNASPLKGLTLIEILIIVSVLALLALVAIPTFIGVGAEEKVIQTRSNLDTLRTVIELFYEKEGRYPASLGELSTTSYYEEGSKKLYLKEIPYEFISDKAGNNSFNDRPSSVAPAFSNNGGWVYFTDKGEVYIDWDMELDESWGEYVGQKPSEW